MSGHFHIYFSLLYISNDSWSRQNLTRLQTIKISPKRKLISIDHLCWRKGISIGTLPNRRQNRNSSQLQRCFNLILLDGYISINLFDVICVIFLPNQIHENIILIFLALELQFLALVMIIVYLLFDWGDWFLERGDHIFQAS